MKKRKLRESSKRRARLKIRDFHFLFSIFYLFLQSYSTFRGTWPAPFSSHNFLFKKHNPDFVGLFFCFFEGSISHLFFSIGQNKDVITLKSRCVKVMHVLFLNFGWFLTNFNSYFVWSVSGQGFSNLSKLLLLNLSLISFSCIWCYF